MRLASAQPLVSHAQHFLKVCGTGSLSRFQEATEAVKPLLGAYYLRDDTPVPSALWHSWTHCKFVDSTGDILHFKAK